jgi:hypothetical protein
MLRRLTILLTTVLAVLTLAIVVDYAAVYAEDANAWAVLPANLRSQPSQQGAVLTTLETNTPVVMEARNNDATWLLVHSAGTGVRGWSKRTLFKVAPGIRLYSLPLSIEEVGAGSTAAGSGGNTAAPAGPSTNPENTDPNKVPVYTIPAPPLPGGISNAEIKEPIIPVVTGRIRAAMRNVLARGRQMGNNPQVFAKVGDCHTDHPFFFNIVGNGTYNLGQYGYLQDVINYYSVSPREGAGNSFNVDSQAANSAFSAGSVLDWQLADPGLCKENESPLRCEYRLNKPAVAIIDFGIVDVLVMTPQQFNLYMRILVNDSIEHGVIPVLSTAAENASNPEKSRQFNQIVLKIAREKSLPLINLAGALAGLPNKGLDPDGIHLSRPAAIEQAAVFNDENLKYGYVMRNLVVLQALDAIRRQILQ